MNLKQTLKTIGIISLLVTICSTATVPALAAESTDKSSPLPSFSSKNETAPSTTTAPKTTTATGTGSKTISAGVGHYHYFGQQLETIQERQLYSVMEDELLTSRKPNTTPIRFEPPIKLSGSLNPNDEQAIEREAVTKLKRALDAFKFDHPQFYWITGNSRLIDVQIRVYNDGSIYLHSAAAYFEVANDIAGDRDKIAAVSNNIIAEAKKQTTHVGRIKTVHDMLAKQITYGNEQSYRGYQISGAFVDGIGTCEAYSKSFKFIMDKLGYENVIAAGVGTNKGKKIPHMWNYVKVDGNWYAVDVTWDDQKIIVYDYFLAGKNTVAPNFDNKTFGQEHTEEYTFSYLDYENFYYPKLSNGSYR